MALELSAFHSCLGHLHWQYLAVGTELQFVDAGLAVIAVLAVEGVAMVDDIVFVLALAFDY